MPLLLAMIVSCGDSTAPPSGSLAFTIAGLPSGVSPAVVVTGPAGFRATIDATRTLPSLPAGTYTIVASDVTSAGARYTASPATQTITIGDGAPGTASPITYTLATARLAVSMSGLPIGTVGSATVTGPGGFSRVLTGTTQVDLLEPGTYSVVASDIQVGAATYRPSQRTQVVVLTASSVPASATILYVAGTAVLDVTIAGLAQGVDGAVTVTGPSGYARTLIGSTTLDGLEAGTYTVAPAIVGNALTTFKPTPASQSTALATGGTAVLVVTYVATPLELSVQLVADALTQPVFVTAPIGDTRLFIVERGGRIRVVVNGALLATPFLDMRSRVNNAGERGLLGMAFDPGYATNGFFYVYYVDVSGDIAVERVSSTPGSNVAGSSSGLLVVIPHRGAEHHGGMIAFGPDSLLYFAPGDGGCCGDPQNNAQNLNSLLGKVLRIDVRTVPYTIPASNPFVGRSGMRGEIWAYGLRSPWRFSFDAPTASVFIGDVGQDAREEVNVAPVSSAGLNYGWRFMEGIACYNPSLTCEDGRTLTLPAYDYPHSDGCSVIGGYVYRGVAIPELTGHYLFGDFCRGWLRSFRNTTSGAADVRAWAGIALPQTVSFGRDGAGELYVVAQTRVWRIMRKP